MDEEVREWIRKKAREAERGDNILVEDIDERDDAKKMIQTVGEEKKAESYEVEEKPEDEKPQPTPHPKPEKHEERAEKKQKSDDLGNKGEGLKERVEIDGDKEKTKVIPGKVNVEKKIEEYISKGRKKEQPIIRKVIPGEVKKKKPKKAGIFSKLKLSKKPKKESKTSALKPLSEHGEISDDKPESTDSDKGGFFNKKRLLIILGASVAGALAGYLLFIFLIK